MGKRHVGLTLFGQLQCFAAGERVHDTKARKPKMGVHGLLPFVAQKAPAAVRRVGYDMTSFAGQTAAVDVAIQMHRIVNATGSAEAEVLFGWFAKQHRRFLAEHITPVYVFDGAKLAAKELETARRTDALVKAGQRATMARARYQTLQLAALGAYADIAALPSFSPGRAKSTLASAGAGGGAGAQQTAADDDELVTAMYGSDGEAIAGAAAGAGIDTAAVAEAKIEDDLRVATPLAELASAGETLRKAEARLIKPTRAHYDAVREYLGSLGARCVVAPTEAEKECARMCAAGEVHVVITTDADALAFGAPRVLFQYGSPKAYVVELAEVLWALDMSLDLFRQLCVMAGCDFCERVPNVGPGKAYPLLKAAGSIAALLEARAAVQDARFCESTLGARIAEGMAGVAALESQVAELHECLIDAGTDTTSAHTNTAQEQVGELAALLERTREDVDADRKQLEGLRAFKARYAAAYDIFTRPDDVVLPAMAMATFNANAELK